MRIRHALVGTLAGTALALGSMAVPAQAAPAAASAPAAGGTAPACIVRSVNYNSQGFWVYLENTCSRTMSLQVVVTDGPDSSCFSLGADDTTAWFYSFNYGTDGRYARTAVC